MLIKVCSSCDLLGGSLNRSRFVIPYKGIIAPSCPEIKSVSRDFVGKEVFFTEERENRICDAFADALRLEGINCRGYGIIPKLLMTDRDLTIESKAIYAYFCSYSGAGNSAFPGRDRILADLGMSKDAYYKHYNLLLEHGYLTVQQVRSEGSRFLNNLYTLVSMPEKFSDPTRSEPPAGRQSSLRFSGLKEGGYGQIPKALMTDRRLSVKSKGLYAYYAAFTGSGESAFPEKGAAMAHLNIGIHVFEKLNRELLRCNYITVIQRHVNGRLGVNEVFLNDRPDAAQGSTAHTIRKMPAEATQCYRIQDTDGAEASFQSSGKQDTELQDAGRQDAAKPDSNINSLQNQQSDKNNSSEKEEEILRRFRENRNMLRSLTAPGMTPKTYSNGHAALQDEVTKKLFRAGGLTPEILEDRAAVKAAVEILTDDPIMGNPNAYARLPEGKKAYEIFCLYRDCLTELLSARRGIRLGEQVIPPEELREKIGAKLTADGEKACLELADLYDEVFAGYSAGAQTGEIAVPKRYMKACIWNAL